MEIAPTAAEPLPLVTPDLLLATCTAEGDCLHANEAWTAVFGDDGLWGRLPLEDVRFASEYLTDAARGLMVSHQVFLVERPKHPEPTPVLLHFLPVRLPDVQPGQFPVALTGEVLQEPTSWAADQTRRRRMEMLGQMTMGIAHDFNNLLTTILGHAELLHGRLDDLSDGEPIRTHLVSMERAASDGAALVKKIQQYIRHEKQDRFEPVALRTLAEEVITLTRPYWHNEPRRQGIALHLERDLQPVPTVSGWPTELREVLVNLILNAVQAMPSGGTLTVRTHHDPARGGIVEVQDSGVGMSERVKERIYEPLFTTKGEGGTGMGLTVSYGIVQEHNGAIEVESKPGRGTCFRLVFPIAEAGTDLPHAKAPPPEDAATPFAQAGSWRILVVDDEPMVRTVTAKLLGLKGHHIVEADGGPTALALLQDDAFDLIITDLSMPDMNGRELAYRIRQETPDQPIILLTGDTDAQEGAEHVDAVVQKPFKLEALDAVIQRVLSEGQAAR